MRDFQVVLGERFHFQSAIENHRNFVGFVLQRQKRGIPGEYSVLLDALDIYCLIPCGCMLMPQNYFLIPRPVVVAGRAHQLPK